MKTPITCRRFLAGLAASLLTWPAFAQISEPNIGLKDYENVLQNSVKPNDQGTASEVDYAWLAQHQADLDAVTDTFSGVSEADFSRWSDDAQLAFLINAYNAFTLQLILTKYPDLESIKDLGSLFRSPWKQKFVALLGKTRSLDDIEHTMIRGQFDEPRIHAAVNCASCGCPALLAQPFKAETLDQQLHQAMSRFLADAERNYFEASSKTLWLSPLFDWYGEDFEKSAGSVERYARDYSGPLGWPPSPADTKLRIRFTDYDWQLNDLGRCAD
ncbi:MAG: DUF547 domain-containing protein [Lysobacterales bacterium]